MLEFLRLAVGYSVTGTTREKVVLFCYGEGGDNGKTTFLGTLRELVGEFGKLLTVDTLMTKQQEDNNSKADLADLFGARFVMTSEVDDGQRLSEGKLKRITQGMATIKACRKYENPFEFPETHKLWLDCNHLPVISTGGKALWRRIRVIPWLITIPKAEQDADLKTKLMGEAEGILAWAISGAVDWYGHGLPTPPEVDQANAEYQDKMDHLKDWLEECCVISDKIRRYQSSVLYGSYKQFAERNRHRGILDSKEFKTAMNAKGIQDKRESGAVFWVGVGLREDGPM